MSKFSFSSRNTVEECARVSIFSLIRTIKKEIKRVHPESSKAEISKKTKNILRNEYFNTSKRGEIIQSLEFISTPTNLGIGERYWIRCPSCRRRVAILYKPPFDRFYLCRICHKLIYRSQLESDRRVNGFLKNPAELTRLRKSKNLSTDQKLLLLEAEGKLAGLKIKKFLREYYSKRRHDDIEFDLRNYSFRIK